MRTVTVTETFPASVHDAETHWYDTARWPSWVEGCDHVVDVGTEWPRAGATVTWQSGPAGRGQVRERVLSHEPLDGQELEVEDDSIRGRQSITFTPANEGVQVAFGLEYELKRRTALTPVVDLLFIRRAMVSSMQTTLARFRLELGA